ncbi:SRPBCC family protein [Arthrobacter sulfonylureivorans]|uniref:SRPBCC family protein n=1 Tax=Arthrobacter sulfonylureivorans TaxID=2486855 RepID=UPI003BB1A9FC
MKRSGSIVIHRPADEVFAFLAEVHNETSWRDSVTGSGYIGEGSAAVGTDGYTEVSMGGKQVRMDWRISSFDPGRHVAWQLTGGPWQGGGCLHRSAVERPHRGDGGPRSQAGRCPADA